MVGKGTEEWRGGMRLRGGEQYPVVDQHIRTLLGLCVNGINDRDKQCYNQHNL
jgi:hypothetical protein